MTGTEVGILLLVVWVGCGFMAYGITLGYFVDEFPSLPQEDNIPLALCLAILGFLGFTVAIVMASGNAVKNGRYKLQWRIKK